MTTGTPPPRGPSAPQDGGSRSLEEVRAELRALGYLRDPLGGFLVPHSSARATFLRVSLLTSLRSGLLGGALLAWPLAAALAHLSRPHFAGIRDLLLLGLYLLPLLAAALAALNLCGDLLIRALAARRRGSPRRGERLAARIGAALAGGSSLYLALVWGRRGGPGGWTAAAGAVLVAAAGVLVGWLVRSGALAAVASIGGRLEGRGRSRTPIAAIAAAALLGAAVVLATGLSVTGAPRPRPMPPLAAAPGPGRLVVVGLDGLDAAWLDALAARTEAPAVRSLLEGSARWDLAAYPSDVPPEVWTSIATGVPGEVHGVRSFEVHTLPGLRSPLLPGPAEPAARATVGSALRVLALLGPEASAASPLSSFLRRSWAVWEIMARAGRTAAVLNWWGTWPAAAEGSIVVSDRALGALLAAAGRDPSASAAAPEGLAHPRALQAELASSFAAARRAVEDRLGPEEPLLTESKPEWRALVRAAFLADGYHLDLAARILDRQQVGALLVYLPGQDIVLGGLLGEAGTERAGPREGGAPLAAALRMLTAQQILLRELDRGLGVLLSRLGAADLLVVVADPGRYLRVERRDEVRGLLLLHGGRVERSGRVGAGSELDVAPTILALAGLPKSEEQPGSLLRGLAEALPDLPASSTIGTFGDRPPSRLEGVEGSEAVLDRLRSLGYIR